MTPYDTKARVAEVWRKAWRNANDVGPIQVGRSYEKDWRWVAKLYSRLQPRTVIDLLSAL